MKKSRASGRNGGPPCLFLSHSGVDSDAAKLLKTRILSTKAAQDAGLEVWFDKDELLPGVEGWQSQLEIALTRKATAFAVLVGSKGVVNWVEREVRIGLSRATGDGAIPFIPILAKDAPGVSALPLFAQQHQCVNDPLGSDEELRRLVAAALESKPADIPLIDEPFVGLRSMTEADAGRFFGRDDEVADLVARLRRHRLLAIVADSGAGKSSLAMAGLVPAFRGGAFADPASRGPDRRAWHVVVMRPGADPLEGLRRGLTETGERMGLDAEARAGLRRRLDLADVSESAYALRCDLPAGTTETLLVVDQFDELLTETPEEKRAAFVDFLTSIAAMPEPGGFRVVLTVRADYFNLCRPFATLYGQLTAADEPATLRLKRISDAGLEQAVRRPLELAGYRKAGDTDRLARRTRTDLGDRAGDLALAQMALYVVWHRRKAPDGTLIDAYADVGGVTGALAQEAERVRTDKLSPAEAELLTPLFVRLVRLGETGGAVRRICYRSELDPARHALADKLCSDAHGRLLLAGDDTYEVCHEALITQWPWLQDELNRAAGDLRDLDPLMRRAAMWAAAPDADRPGHLATGVEREAFAGLAVRRRDWLSKPEIAFVEASDAEFVRFAEVKQAESRFRKRVAQAALAASIVFAMLTGFAWWQTRNAIDEAELAKRAADRAVESETVSLAALSRVALSEKLPVEAVKLALAAWPRMGEDNRLASRRAAASLASAFPQFRERHRLEGHRYNVTSADFSPDGTRIVTASADKTARVWDATTGASVLTLEGHGNAVSSAVFSPDGTRIITASADRTARVLDAATGEPLITLEGHVSSVRSAAFSPDGRRIVTASADNAARVWDAATGAHVLTLEGHGDWVWSAAFSRDMARIVTASSDNTARVWDAATGKTVLILEGHLALVSEAAFSPDGARVLTASHDRTARIWDTATGALLLTLEGHGAGVDSAAFSPDGALIVTASLDRTARVWDAATGAPFVALEGHANPVTSSSFSPDGSRIVTASVDDTARVWETATREPVLILEGHGNDVTSSAFSPDGSRIVTASLDRTARVWDAATGAPLMTLEGHGAGVLSASFSPDGTRIVTASWDNTARVWIAATGSPVLTIKARGGPVTSAAFSPDGTRIVTASWDNTARVWIAATGAPTITLEGHGDGVLSAAFSPDGMRIVTASADNTARFWDAVTGAPALIVEGHGVGISSAAFSPDGARIVTASVYGMARVWDAATGAPLMTFEGHGAGVLSAAFSPNGARIVTASQDNTARHWDISSLEKGHAFQIACQRLGNNTSLRDVQERFGLGDLTPICGANAPLPIALSTLP